MQVKWEKSCFTWVRAHKSNHLATFCLPLRDTLPPGQCFGILKSLSFLFPIRSLKPCLSHICFQDLTLIFGTGSYMVLAGEKIRMCSTILTASAAGLVPRGKTERKQFVQTAQCYSCAATML